ncbi:MAG TPA: hypothetical protein VGD67_25290, partial [Pseudonocardiaceae bacterium]
MSAHHTGDAAAFRCDTVPWVVDGDSADDLRARAERLRAHLAGGPATIRDLGRALAANRNPGPHRAVLLADSPEGITAELAAL